MLVYINNTISLSVIQMEPPCTVIQRVIKRVFFSVVAHSCVHNNPSQLVTSSLINLGCSGLISIQSVMFTSTVNYRVMYLNFEHLTLQFHRNVCLWLGKRGSFPHEYTSGSEDKFVILLLESILLQICLFTLSYN